MEPRLPTPNPSPEMGNYQSEKPRTPGEVLPGMPKIEQQPRVETHEQQPGAQGPGDPAAAQQTVPPPIPTPILPATPAAQHDDPTNSNPIQAADEELIEKEWVDKAKKIVQSTRDDPYLQEKEVNKLQADYISKRYGKTIKVNSD